ncbi:gamma-glutamylcyclotransferase [Tenacibaculum polynesiense]
MEVNDNWEQLDEFEGTAYQRIKTIVILEETNEEVEAYIYVLK